MRDERWVNRFNYAWNDTLFYDPLDVYYTPRRDHFLAELPQDVRSRFVRAGIWWSYRHNPTLPTQGWKIHVSATQRNVREVAAAVIGHLTTRGVDFKIALDLNIFEMLNQKPMGRGSSGKLITIYPRDDDEFRDCLAELADLLRDAAGAYVLSDMRYKDSKALYFRYGQLLDTHSVDAMGRKKPHITGPDGRIADDRRPVFTKPWWLPWPFSDWKPDDDPGSGDLLGGRFRVTDAIQFSNTGGVYRAQDTADGDRLVVLKEARPHTGVNPRQDHDAVDILGREWTFLNRLADTGCFPAPIATFRHWEHHFIAEEFVEGVDFRSVLLDDNPLIRPGFDLERSRHYLRTFVRVFRGLARAIQAAHERQVILGDFTPANLIVDPYTFEVVLVDLESCRLAESDADDAHLQGSVELFTPGFSHSRRHRNAATTDDDLYGLAMTMAYFVFPVAAMSFLREDVLDLYRTYTDALGWPARIHELLTDLAQARISLADVLRFLDDEADLVGAVVVPAAEPVAEEALRPADVTAGIAAFVAASADTDRASLFPVDPFAHITNPLSLGFGASGVLWALNASGCPVLPEWRRWLRDRLAAIDVDEYPAGLMSGLAGIAWAADGLGLHTQARELLARANEAGAEDYTFYYGLAGLGMTNLRFYLQSHDERDLAAARECAHALSAAALRDGRWVYWLNDFASKGPLTGLGFGQAGVAMFLLRMHQITGDASCLRLGEGALAWEMANAEPQDDGSVMFVHERTGMPYVEVGAAGVAQVLLRYGDLDAARTVLRGVRVGHTSLGGYGFGMSGIADAMLDAATILGDPSYRDTAVRQLAHVREVFLFEPPARFGIPRRDGIAPLALPGDGLLRCSCDLMTGSAGALRVFHRLRTGGPADFLLDEVAR
ncbi:class III lanthionine synthetase LanKC [Actinophytocola sp.]|uniref:class III lanthionine synthetase LanKC n=1 Tax=Actinophytocola sp. TaxID=1872138 RepID=UPI002ED3A45A